jgi:hypothetical protein
MEKLMKEVHALVCHGPRIKESQVFVSMFEQLSINASKYRMPKGLFSFQNFAKFFKILRHITSLDTCMKH